MVVNMIECALVQNQLENFSALASISVMFEGRLLKLLINKRFAEVQCIDPFPRRYFTKNVKRFLPQNKLHWDVSYPSKECATDRSVVKFTTSSTFRRYRRLAIRIGL